MSKRRLVTDTVQRTGLSEQVVEPVLTYYWKLIRSFMQTPTDTAIHLNGLGTFSLIPYFVKGFINEKEIYIDRMTKKIEAGEPVTEGQLAYFTRCTQDIIWLKKMRDRLQDNKQHKKVLKLKREEHVKTEQVVEASTDSVKEPPKNTKGLLETIMERYMD